MGRTSGRAVVRAVRTQWSWWRTDGTKTRMARKCGRFARQLRRTLRQLRRTLRQLRRIGRVSHLAEFLSTSSLYI
jgi:hypothetical protein